MTNDYNGGYYKNMFPFSTLDSSVNKNGYAKEAQWSLKQYIKFINTYFSSDTGKCFDLTYFLESNMEQRDLFVQRLDSEYKGGAKYYDRAESFLVGDYVRLGYFLKNNGDTNYISSIDIIAHEWTHHISSGVRKIQYERESGALNESFSDILGFGAEEFSRNITKRSRNWIIGEDMVEAPNIGIRSMSNPPLLNQPDYYEGTYWINTKCCEPKSSINDYCGAHTNSGVQNKWFYLIVQGDTLTRKGAFYKIDSNGLANALKIVWQNLMFWSNPEMTYLDSRRNTQKIASILFPTDTFIQNNVYRAWDAVGVFPTSFIVNKTTVLVSPGLQNTPHMVDKYWHKDSSMPYELVIEPYVNLHIENDSIEMMEGSRILIKKGAKLTIKNSFIEGSMGGCNIVKWRGIELEPNVSQASNSVKLYAEIDIDSSTIKRASCAIKSGASYNFNYRKDFGGNIKISHSQIDGCDTTILQFIDVNGTNYLNINYCNFYGEDKRFALSNKTVTKNHIIIGTSNNLNFVLDKAKISLYPDSIYTIKIQNTLFDGCYNSVITTDNLCNWGEVGATGIFSVCNPIKGMKLENNIFANFIGKNVSLLDIENIAKLEILNNTFSGNIKFAIRYSTAGLKTNPYTNIYLNNFFGSQNKRADIYLSNVPDVTIENNEFEGHEFQRDSTDSIYSAIQAVWCSGINISKNHFKLVPLTLNPGNANYSYGVVVQHSGAAHSYFWKNSLSGNYLVGLQTEGNNQNLNVRCNIFSDDKQEYKLTAFGVLNGKIRNQGWLDTAILKEDNCISHKIPAGNEWLDTNNVNNWERQLKVGPNVDSFIYISHTFKYNSTIVVTAAYRSHQILNYYWCQNPLGMTKLINSCDEMIKMEPNNPGTDKKGKLVIKRGELLDKIWNRKQELTDPEIQRDLVQEIRTLKTYLEAVDMDLKRIYELEDNQEALDSILDEEQSAEAKVILIHELISQGKIAEAEIVSNLLDNFEYEAYLFTCTANYQKYQLNNEYVADIINLKALLIEESRSSKNLKEEEVELLLGIQQADLPVSAESNIILQAYFDKKYIHDIGQFPGQIIIPLDSNNEDTFITEISPNPANNQINVGLHLISDNFSYNLKIASIFQPNQFQYSSEIIERGNLTKEISIQNFSNGYYIISIFENNILKASKIFLKE